MMMHNLYVFLRSFNSLGVACRRDIYRESRLATDTINKCVEASIRGKLIVGASGDNRTHNYKLTKEGKEMIRLLNVMIDPK
jgi:hypothetical protein